MTEDKLTFRDALLYPKAMIVKNATKYINIIAFIVHHPISDEMQYEITNCKLILRDISQLTDEEKRYICREYLSNVKQSDIDWGSVFVVFCYCKTIKDTINLLDYLREKNIMIEKTDWFKSGKAVKDE